MNPQKRRALVTGGAGFLGPHLVRRLLDEGWNVGVLDNFSSGRRAHVEPLRANPAFSLFEGSINDAAFAGRTVESFQPDVVYHLAAIHFIPYCVSHPAETIEVNALGTQRMIDALEKTAPGCRFVFASTADVYAPADAPHAETDRLGSPNIYGTTKELGERLLALGRVRFPKSRFLAARFFNIYGPGETNPHILPDIMTCLRTGRVLRLGNIEPKRDYVFTSDVADALWRMADYEGKELAFNVASGQSRSVRELVGLLEKVLGEKITIETDPAKLRKSERQNLAADISLAKRELGWAPKVGIEEGLAATLRAELESPRP